MAERQRGWDQTTSYRVIEDHFEIHLSYEKMTNLKIHIKWKSFMNSKKDVIDLNPYNSSKETRSCDVKMWQFY